MRIKITKGNGWYENKVGEVLDVIRVQKNRLLKKEYVVWEGKDGDYNWVDEDDCEEYRGGLSDPDGGDYPLKWMGLPKATETNE